MYTLKLLTQVQVTKRNSEENTEVSGVEDLKKLLSLITSRCPDSIVCIVQSQCTPLRHTEAFSAECG